MTHRGDRDGAVTGGGLTTDLYQLNMASSYLRRNMSGLATFSLYLRRLPASRGFVVAAGLADCLDFLANFGFTDADLDYLRDPLGFDETAVEALAQTRFTGDVYAVPEGTLVLADEPLLEVTAPIAEAQLVETALLNYVTFASAVATKAARCVIAAKGAQLVDFSFRRTQGIEAGLTVARASAIAGFVATSNVEAARRYGLVAAGTMAHSFIEAFPDEQQAFEAFAADYPGKTTFLVDTYDSGRGVRAAIEVAQRLGLQGPLGIRLDSGDLLAQSKMARRMLDDAGFTHARIFASGSLDEFAIAELVAAGAPINAYGVGTKMGVSEDAPFLDSAYKLVEYDGRPVMKLSVGKHTWPGAKQVWRVPDGDVLALRDEPGLAESEPLLVPVMRAGQRVTHDEPIAALVERCAAGLAALPPAAAALNSPVQRLPRVSDATMALRDALARKLTPAALS